MTDASIEELFKIYCLLDSDIQLHLPILLEYGKRCDHITEMGARHGFSTVAFLNAKAKRFVSYDYQYSDPEPHSVNEIEKLKKIFEQCQELGQNCQYIGADVLKVDIETTDLLFIDTWHCYEQIKRELELHASKVSKYLIFHDTFTYGEVGEKIGDCDVFHPYLGMPISGKGIRPAIDEFMAENLEWKIKYEAHHNNGLLILARNS